MNSENPASTKAPSLSAINLNRIPRNSPFFNGLITVVRRIANRFGVEISKAPQKSDLHYEEIHPMANYCPWNKDKVFEGLYEEVKDFTLVDKYRCFELYKLVEQVSKLETGALIEIGVWRGASALMIGTQALNCGIKDPVFLCDTFTGVVKAGSNDSLYKGGEHSDVNVDDVRDFLIQKKRLSNVQILQGIFPDDTGHAVGDVRFRFCHVDVDVYQSAKDVVEWIWDKMVVGGIVVYDDYGFYACDGVTKFVEEQTALKDRLVIYNLNGHAVVIKLY